MSARSLFGVIVRSVGLWLLLRGIGGLLGGIIGAAEALGINYFGLRGGWLISLLYVLGGLYLLRAAPMVVRLAYAADDERG